MTSFAESPAVRHSLFRPVLSLLLVGMLLTLAGCAMPGLFQPQPGGAEKPKGRTATVAIVTPAKQNPSVTVLVAGARIAAQELSDGASVHLTEVRAEGAWLKTLGDLPKDAIIGAVVTDAMYKQMKDAGVMARHPVFVFKAELPAGDEGSTAWRFFPSLEDQIDAVVKLCVDQMGIRDVASFSGTDRFSAQATGLFEQKLAAKNVILTRIAAEGDPSSWPLLVKPVVNPQTDEMTGALTPQTPFQALFVPESWRRLSDVHTAFASNGEDRLLILGNMLWDGYNLRGTQNAQDYALVTYPTAYLKSRAPKSLASSHAGSFWGALGYDFVRFAQRMVVNGRPESRVISQAARQAALMNFVLAPISYDNAGKASQKLFMVQPGVSGATLATVDSLQAARQAAIERTQSRVPQDPTLDVTPTEGSSLPNFGASEARAATLPAQQPSGPIMRQTPHSSHKLSLPGAK